MVITVTEHPRVRQTGLLHRHAHLTDLQRQRANPHQTFHLQDPIRWEKVVPGTVEAEAMVEGKIEAAAIVEEVVEVVAVAGAEVEAEAEDDN